MCLSTVVCVCLALCLTWLPGVAAADLVDGDEDTNGPLTIQPAGEGTVHQLTGTTGSQAVFFIQRLPAGKTVRQITLGDFAVPAGCTTPTTVRLLVEHHPSHRWRGGSPDRYLLGVSLEDATVTATPGKLAFVMDERGVPGTQPITLLKDGTYSFWLQRVSGCSELLQTTWEHPGGLVEGGPACDYGLPYDAAGENPPNNSMRLWHQGGAGDAQPECVSDPSTGWDPLMPSGWLVTHRPSTMQYVQKYSEPILGPPADECWDAGYTTKGIRGVYWRLSPYGSSRDYVCQWSQFHPREVDGKLFRSRDDWFYALPFRSGRPALDIYVRLDVIDYDALLQRHAPVWAFDEEEQFHPQRANAFVENFRNEPSCCWSAATSNSLFNGSGERLAAAGAPSGSGQQVLTTGMLGSSYLFGTVNEPPAGEQDYLDARGSDLQTYLDDAAWQRDHGYGDIAYGRAVEGTDNTIWMQYWVFYYYNSFRHLTKGEHEGDWEMIQVGLDRATKIPTKVTFATHTDGEACTWSQVVKGDPTGERPVAYVAARSHASYPKAGTSDLPWGAEDRHLGGGVWKIPPLEIIAYTNPRWTTWPGRWGSSIGEGAPLNGEFKSPLNISKQGPKWNDPTAFHAAAAPCSVGP